jgi:hypothetical protein
VAGGAGLEHAPGDGFGAIEEQPRRPVARNQCETVAGFKQHPRFPGCSARSKLVGLAFALRHKANGSIGCAGPVANLAAPLFLKRDANGATLSFSEHVDDL